jgi:hypothetical protein
MRSALRGLLRGPDLDVVLAFAAFAALLIDPVVSHQVKELTPLAAGLALLTALPLAVRRRHPLGVLAVVVPLLLVCLAVFHPDHAAAGIVMLLVFTVGLNGHRFRSLVVGALMAPLVTAGVLITSTRGDEPPKTVAYVALVLGALAAGDAVRAARNSYGSSPRRPNTNVRLWCSIALTSSGCASPMSSTTSSGMRWWRSMCGLLLPLTSLAGRRRAARSPRSMRSRRPRPRHSASCAPR